LLPIEVVRRRPIEKKVLIGLSFLTVQ
jgi:hypothetical protein